MIKTVTVDIEVPSEDDLDIEILDANGETVARCYVDVSCLGLSEDECRQMGVVDEMWLQRDFRLQRLVDHFFIEIYNDGYDTPERNRERHMRLLRELEACVDLAKKRIGEAA